jgi:cytidine deaminase
MIKKDIRISIFEYKSVDEMNEADKLLIEQAKSATLNSYAPYSKFHVGAAVLLENGETIIGSNQENAAYPSGICAERVALFYANSKFPEIKVNTIAIVARTNGSYTELPIPPCGSCRQVMMETEIRFKKPIKIILYGEEKILVIDSASTLLPIGFGEDFLRKK